MGILGEVGLFTERELYWCGVGEGWLVTKRELCWEMGVDGCKTGG